MSPEDDTAFKNLLNAVFLKCFGRNFKIPLSEVEGKQLANEIQERTGLIIGWKSLKNYSQYLLNDSLTKEENPSIATLDTLARYVLEAPVTNEVSRKTNESHYPYWFKYRNEVRTLPNWTQWRKRIFVIVFIIAGIIFLFVLIITRFESDSLPHAFSDDFNCLDEDSLNERGWFVVSADPEYWNRRTENEGLLTLYTLKGDNWPDSSEATGIKNLMLRKIQPGCYFVEVHLKDFIPIKNWQQAGILILEDTSFAGKSVRMSLAYNDYFGGFTRPGEIFIQVITSLGKGFRKPEEIAHHEIFSFNGIITPEMKLNLKNSSLRIERHGNSYRFLYAVGEMDNSAYREIARQDFEMEPNYVGIFALKGFVNDTLVVPVCFNRFTFTDNPCK